MFITATSPALRLPTVVIGLLIVAIAAAILIWILLNGTNPIHFSAPAS